MGAKSYIGINGTARKLKKSYIGIDGTARKIKKIYMGVADVAHKIFGGGDKLIHYQDLASTLPYSVANFEGRDTAHVGKYALFGPWGYRSYYNYSSIDDSLTINNNVSRGVSTFDPSTDSQGDYALIMGGCEYTNGKQGNTVAQGDAYDKSLTKTTLSLDFYMRSGGAGHINGYSIFGGGGAYSGFNSSVCAFDSSLTKTSLTSLNTARQYCYGISTSTHVIFTGGNGATYNNDATVDVFDKSLTHSTAESLNTGRYYSGVANAGKYAMVYGGRDTNGTTYDTIDIYDESLTHSVLTADVAICFITGISVGNSAVFVGGTTSSNTYPTTIHQYDDSLVHTYVDDLPSNTIGRMQASKTGDYILFAYYNVYAYTTE